MRADYLWVLGVSFVVLTIGLISLLREKRNINSRLVYAIEFREKFIEYCNSHGDNRELYTWLTLNSNRMQSDMGPHGVYGMFRPPHADYSLKNYPIITNMLPEIRKYFGENRNSLGSIFSSVIDQYVHAVDEALIRFIGVLQEAQKKAESRSQNPLQWWKQGIERILIAPVWLLSSFDVVGNNIVGVIERNFLFKLVVALLAIVALMANLTTIAQGFEVTKKLASQIFAVFLDVHP